MFGRKVRKLRQQKGMTLRELAEKAGLAASHLGLIETGRIKQPRVEAASQIAAALRVPLSALTEKRRAT